MFEVAKLILIVNIQSGYNTYKCQIYHFQSVNNSPIKLLWYDRFTINI